MLEKTVSTYLFKQKLYDPVGLGEISFKLLDPTHIGANNDKI